MMIHPGAIQLNAIAPYFTMFPLDFPLSLLQERAKRGERVLDPFCGRGTTNFAARLLGLDSLGVDVNPVAVAITAAKLVSPTVEEILAEAKRILARPAPKDKPEGEFWTWAYHPATLQDILRFREAFLEESSSPVRLALRGLLLGALHGPLKKPGTYLSNQAPRTYAPKPAYAVRFWRARGLKPPRVDVLEVLRRRAHRYYTHPLPELGKVLLGDSRRMETFKEEKEKFHWVITSPPYYGMRTYIADQWLRYWFLGGPDSVSYGQNSGMNHGSPEHFASDLAKVWNNIALQCEDGAVMVIRFGGIGSRKANPLGLLFESLGYTPWKVVEIRPVPPAPRSRRQAISFLREVDPQVTEWDCFCRLVG